MTHHYAKLAPGQARCQPLAGCPNGHSKEQCLRHANMGNTALPLATSYCPGFIPLQWEAGEPPRKTVKPWPVEGGEE